MESAAVMSTRQFLVFKLEDQEYGIDIKRIVSIIRKDMAIARVPKSPEFVKGVINLRGEIIPVIDLRRRFGIASAEDTEETRIIVVKIEDITVGFIVDLVSEVIHLSEDSIENAASLDELGSLDYIYGVGKSGERLVTLLDLKKIIGINEI